MNKKNKTILIVLAIIIFAGTVLRFYNLGEKSFRADEFLGVNTVYGYLQTGEWKRWDFNLEKPYQDKPYFKTIFDFDLWGKKNTYVRAWIYNWQIAQSLKFLPTAKEWSYRVISAIWGVISLLLIYFITVKFTGKKIIGLLAVALLAVSIDGIEFSRKVRMYAMFMPVFFSFAYFAFQFFESKRKCKFEVVNKLTKKTGLNLFFLLPTIFLGLLSIHLHLLAANFIFILLAYFLVMGIIYYSGSKQILNRYFVYTALLVFAGWLLSLTNKVFFAGIGVQDHFSYFEKSFYDYSNAILVFLLMVVGASYFIKRKMKAGVFIVSAYLTIFLGAMFLWDRNTGSQYLFFAKPFQIILIAGGIFAVADFLKKNLKNYNNKIFVVTLAILFLIVPNFAYFFQDENTYVQTSRSGNPNYKKVFKYVVSKRDSRDVLITRNFRNFYWANQHIKVYSLGGERATKSEKKLTLKRLQKIMMENSSGWLVYSDNDTSFISKDAKNYIIKNLTRVSNSRVRGPISVYKWGE